MKPWTCNENKNSISEPKKNLATEKECQQIRYRVFFFKNKLGFTPWKAELLQQDMELNRKKKGYRKDFYREPKEKNASIKT